MANITAADVKKLRDATGAGMMDARRRSRRPTATSTRRSRSCASRASKATKRGAERTASNGLVAAAEGAMIQLKLRDRLRRQERAVPAARRRHRRARGAAKVGDVDGLLAETLADGRTVQENIDSRPRSSARSSS